MTNPRSAYKSEQWDSVVHLGKNALESSSTTSKERQETYLLVGSALRKLNRIDEAINILKKGVAEFPTVAGLHHNLGNCYRAQKLDNKWPVIMCYIRAQELGLKSGALATSLARTYQDMSLSGLAYKTITTWLESKGAQEMPRVDALTLLIELVGIVLEEADSERIGTWCLDNFGELAKHSREGQLSLAIYKARMGDIKEAKELFNAAKRSLIEEQEKNLILGLRNEIGTNNEKSTINSGWNIACSLLKKGDMSSGWSFYNYGLHTPAPGLQRWQRALQKPFDSAEVPIWGGEPLNNRKLLIIGEQAIGDSVMFLQILPQILKESTNISLLIPERLVNIYKRTYPEISVYSDDDIDLIRKINTFDLQIPCGSIPSLRLQAWLYGGWDQVKLQTNKAKVNELKKRYRKDLKSNQPLIGISWAGGAMQSRKRVKSLTGDQFRSVFDAIPNARFVSLQYGRAENMVNEWKNSGYDVIYDNEINALLDMDTWLSQVECCDAVISIANTTIHGAGAIKKPTFCLQSRNSDWRWVDGMNQSYWYETVNTHWQSRDGSWSEAIEHAKAWFLTHSNETISKTTVLNTIQQKAFFAT